jgi:hypothetical protein
MAAILTHFPFRRRPSPRRRTRCRSCSRIFCADQAAFRLDFSAWLAGLPEPKRWVAELLAEGHEGVVVARLVGIAQSRVTQLRHELEASWRAFQSGPASVHERGDLRMARE